MIDLHDKDFIRKINQHLKNGGVIAFPTDTVWGLGALPNKTGADALFEIKQRPREKHLIIMSDTLEHIKPYMKNYPRAAFDLAKKYRETKAKYEKRVKNAIYYPYEDGQLE